MYSLFKVLHLKLLKNMVNASVRDRHDISPAMFPSSKDFQLKAELQLNGVIWDRLNIKDTLDKPIVAVGKCVL